LEGKGPSGEIQIVYGIALALIKLDLWLIVWDTSTRTSTDPLWQAGIEFNGILSEELTTLDLNGTTYIGLPQQDRKLEHYVRGLSKEQVLERLKNMTTTSYLPRMLVYAAFAARFWTTKITNLKQSSGFNLPSLAARQELERDIDEAVEEHIKTRTHLRSIHKAILELHGQSVKAVSLRLLDHMSIEALRTKIASFRDEFHDLCDELGKPRDDLILDADTGWYVIIRTMPPKVTAN
jgi:hypothetical protein